MDMADLAPKPSRSAPRSPDPHGSGCGSPGLAVLLDALRPVRRQIILSAALALTGTLLELVPYLVIWRIAVILIDPTAGSAEQIGIPELALAGLAGALLRFAAQAGGGIIGHAAAFRVERTLRQRLLDHIGRMPLARLDGQGGALKKTLIDDVGRINGVLAHTLPDLVSGLGLPLVAGCLLAWFDWRMALASLALLPLAVAAQARMAAGSSALFTRWSGTEAAANERLLAYVQGIATLKAFNRQARSLEGVRRAVHDLRDLAVSITRRSRYPYALFGLALSFNLAAILPAGLLLHAGGSLTLADLMLFLALGGVLTLPLTRVVLAANGLRQLAACLDRIAALLAEPCLPVVDTPERPDGNTVRFESAGFTHADGTVALAGASLTLAEGRITALVGPSGAGKTTLARLLGRALDCTEGRITIGGADIRRMDPADLAGRLSTVFQDPVLFHGSLADNIRLARPGATDAEVTAAAKAAGADGFIRALPQGYDTPVGDRGARLSGGERQRIAIARAILKDAPILILDEATAHADPQTEHEVQRALATLARGRTVLVIAHRLATIERADRIVVLCGGRVEASGSHATLLRVSPTYAALRRAQDDAARWSLRGNAAAATEVRP
ncbi:ABC transporter ATP-binding protein [Azospirillum sp. HJ39]|uniref:ABC transporter ATP-binding protein n=1 Tax=Azospirillum sp. HJ39 TaxID=3159496 RepID=UPI0035573591